MHPAEGERNAVVGFSAQYGLAARVVLAKLGTLEWISVADPSVGVADDFQFQSAATRHAVQVKWAQYPGSFGWGDLAGAAKGKESLWRRLADAWLRIRTVFSGPLVIHLRSNEHASTGRPGASTPLGRCAVTQPVHFAAFLARSLVPAQEQISRRKLQWDHFIVLEEVADWRPAWQALQVESRLNEDDFLRFIGDLSIHFGPPVDEPLLRPEHAPVDDDLVHLAATLQSLVADPARPVQLSRIEYLDRLGWVDRLRYRYQHAFPIPAVYTEVDPIR